MEISFSHLGFEFQPQHLRGAKVLGDFKKSKHRVESVDFVDSVYSVENGDWLKKEKNKHMDIPKNPSYP